MRLRRRPGIVRLARDVPSTGDPRLLLPLAAALLVLLGIIWLGYPLVVALLARLRRAHPSRQSGDPAPGLAPLVSVVVASADPAAQIAARVHDLLAATYPADRLEIVLALDAVNGRARPEELAGLDGRVRVVPGDLPGGKAATLNAGVRAAAGDLLVFTDTHQRFEPGAIAALVAALRADARLGAVSGALALSGGRRARTPAEWYWLLERTLRANEARLHSVVGVTGAIYAMWRELWAPLPAGLILDDLYVPMRLVLAGRRVGFEPAARATDARTFTASQEFRRKVRTLTGNLQLCAWLPGVLVPWRNPVWLQFLCHKLLRLLTPYLAVGAVLALAAYAVSALWALAGWRALALAASVAALALAHPAIRRRVARQLEWVVLLQAAAVLATVNGVRGRWTVWQR
ncbi:MAG TPA: glycosyltransferase [Gemmatimonadaceae bacterium]|nr:glycosyltransferase [Gemmatimonadaceae bacterium]